jgi:hypothetical protein
MNLPSRLTLHTSITSFFSTKRQVAQRLAVLAKDTPLFDKTGQMPDAEHSSDTVLSYLSVQEGVVGKAKVYGQKFAQFVVDYAVEWEKVVTMRVDRGLKTAEQLRLELDHYQRKVESLRQSANATMVKGKQVDTKAADRLIRNEEKLGKCKDTHTKFIASLCTLMDEVTNRSWRDLHPLLVKIAQFEVTLSGDEAKALSSLNTIVNEFKRLAVTHGIKPQARLKDLDSMDPSLLTTRAPGSGTLAIEAGMGGMSLSNSNDIWSSTSAGGLTAPGSVGSQGMGGFPVAMHGSSDPYSQSSDGSLHSGLGAGSPYGAPSTLDMLSITASAAPPPTVDMLTAAFGPSPSSAPHSGAMVSSPGGFDNYSRTHSSGSFDSGFDSAFSGASGRSAPPPAAPPPLPPVLSQFGSPGAANMNPFGSPASSSFGSPAPTYGAPNAYGAPAPAPSSGQYGQPPPASPYYGNAPSPYGQQSPAYNPGYGGPPPTPPPQAGYGQYGQPSPSYGQPQYNNKPF